MKIKNFFALSICALIAHISAYGMDESAANRINKPTVCEDEMHEIYTIMLNYFNANFAGCGGNCTNCTGCDTNKTKTTKPQPKEKSKKRRQVEITFSEQNN